MNYISTRTKNSEKQSAAYVIKKGLADDGGLFVPESIPSLTKEEIDAAVNEVFTEDLKVDITPETTKVDEYLAQGGEMDIKLNPDTSELDKIGITTPGSDGTPGNVKSNGKTEETPIVGSDPVKLALDIPEGRSIKTSN